MDGGNGEISVNPNDQCSFKVARESCICNEGKPVFARDFKGNPPNRSKRLKIYYSKETKIKGCLWLTRGLIILKMKAQNELAICTGVF